MPSRGAQARHLGWAERAGTGTLFLDEIGDLAPPLQAKLLRLVEERQFHRVGRQRFLLAVSCIGHVFGGEVVRNYRVMHGKVSPIFHDSQGIFAGLSNPFDATRYHSLVIKKETFHHPDFAISAWTQEGEIMGVRHKTWPLHGVQFHPESFLTLEGPKLLRNFMGS